MIRNVRHFAASASVFTPGLVTLILTVAGCKQQNAPVNTGVPLGTYRATLATPGGEVPFGLTLADERDGTVAYLLNGDERLKVTEVKIEGSHLEIKMPGYLNRLSADASNNQLQGEVYLDKLNGNDQHVPLHAQLGEDYRFWPRTPSASGNAEVGGTWAVTFVDDDGSSEVAVGDFKQTGEFVTGTFLTTTGDHRYLAGQVKGDELDLSTFDGAHVYLYKAKLGANGELSGDYWAGMKSHEKWTGKRDAHAALPDAYTLTAMKSGDKHFSFSFPDLSGQTVSDQDAKFHDKVLIVALAGSWCPNCHDEAAFLAPLYKEYKAKGLEVVSLQFEHFGDFPHAADATRRFRQHYGIEYTTLIAGTSDKDDASKRLPSIDKVVAFPTTLFVDRKGNVRKIHTGFSGPATGDHYTQFVQEVRNELDALLAES